MMMITSSGGRAKPRRGEQLLLKSSDWRSGIAFVALHLSDSWNQNFHMSTVFASWDIERADKKRGTASAQEQRLAKWHFPCAYKYRIGFTFTITRPSVRPSVLTNVSLFMSTVFARNGQPRQEEGNSFCWRAVIGEVALSSSVSFVAWSLLSTVAFIWFFKPKFPYVNCICKRLRGEGQLLLKSSDWRSGSHFKSYHFFTLERNT